MNDLEKLEALRAYLLDGVEMTALAKIAELSSGNPCEPLFSIYKIASAAVNKITTGAA